jgi:hypothetical protein
MVTPGTLRFGRRAALSCFIWIVHSLACLLHFYYERNEWASSVSEATMRVHANGATDAGGRHRFAVFMVGNALAGALLVSSEISLARRCRVVRAESDSFHKVWGDHGSILFTLAALLISLLVGTVFGGQDFHGIAGISLHGSHRLPAEAPPLLDWRTRFNVPRASGATAGVLKWGTLGCVALLALLTVARIWQRGRCTIGAQTPLIRPWLLKATGAAVALASVLQGLVDTPASFGLHVSVTIVDGAMAFAYLDVRGLRARRCAAALLCVFILFPLYMLLPPPWGSLVETAAFAGFFACYAFHVDDVRKMTAATPSRSTGVHKDY